MTKKSELAWGLLFGIVFGFLLQKGGVTRYDVIIGAIKLRQAAGTLTADDLAELNKLVAP